MIRYYSIAGHVLELREERPGDIPGFSPFRLPALPMEKPILSIRIEEEHVDTYSLWLAFGRAALYRNTVAIHASTIIYKGKAILFLGESGTGKSTQSRLWQEHIPGTELLNDDSPFIRTGDDGIPLAWGSPWSGKTPCYKNKCVPIAALVRLRQAPHNSIKRLNTIEAIAALHPSMSLELASDPKLSAPMQDCLSVILRQVPVYRLDCLPDKGAVDLVYTTLSQDGWL